MKKMNYKDLYTDTDVNTGENIFYFDKSLKKPYNGLVVDYFKGTLSWEFEVQNGFRTGINLIAKETNYNQDSIEFRVRNALEKIRIVNQYIDKVGIAIE